MAGRPAQSMASFQAKSAFFIVVVLLFAIILSIYFSKDSNLPSYSSSTIDSEAQNHLQGGTHGSTSSATKCLEYSPAFPSVGGPGCSPKCFSDGNIRNTSYGLVYYNATGGWPKELIQNFQLASEILKKYGPVKSSHTRWMKVEGVGGYMHISLDYYCCYTTEEGVKLGEFVNNYSWMPQTIRFGEMVCAIHGYGDMVSIVLMLDEESLISLRKYALQTEADFEHTTGIKKHIPHTKLQGHHMTLATVNQSLFPVRPAIDEINRTIPPRQWHLEPIVLTKNPLCKRCEQAKRLLGQDSGPEKTVLL